jgi:hypothetical protein
LTKGVLTDKGSIIALKIGDVREILTFSITQGYRTVSQQVEMIVREWLKEHGHLKEDQKG